MTANNLQWLNHAAARPPKAAGWHRQIASLGQKAGAGMLHQPVAPLLRHGSRVAARRPSSGHAARGGASRSRALHRRRNVAPAGREAGDGESPQATCRQAGGRCRPRPRRTGRAGSLRPPAGSRRQRSGSPWRSCRRTRNDDRADGRQAAEHLVTVGAETLAGDGLRVIPWNTRHLAQASPSCARRRTCLEVTLDG